MADAQWLATLARAGLLRGSFIPPGDIRHLHLLARQRQKLASMLAAEKNRLHKVLTDAGIPLAVVVSDIHGRSARTMVKGLIAGQPVAQLLNSTGRLRATRKELFEALQTEQLTASHRFVLSELMAHIEELQARMERFEQALFESLEPYSAQLVLLQTLPGIDRIGAAMLLVEIGPDISAFTNAEQLASWVGICPSNNESAGKRKGGKTRKGNAWVRRLLCEFANAAARSRYALKDKFSTMTIRKGRKKSIVALAHKMLRIIFAMLRDNSSYQDRAIDYEALSVKRNAARWIKMLDSIGECLTRYDA